MNEALYEELRNRGGKPLLKREPPLNCPSCNSTRQCTWNYMNELELTM
jgi:positive regulator of sigma E activity